MMDRLQIREAMRRIASTLRAQNIEPEEATTDQVYAVLLQLTREGRTDYLDLLDRFKLWQSHQISPRNS